MKKKQIIGLIIAVILFVFTGVISVFTNTVSRVVLADSLAGATDFTDSEDFPEDSYIAIVQVTGTIQQQTSTNIFETAEGYQHNTTMSYIDDLMDDENNAGILLYVDSPGGTVYESEELYDKLMEYKETGRPIWTYMAHYAASGGYMISMTSDKIYANKNTTTGSIGVILSTYDLSGLYEKLGIRYVSITSGANKDSSLLTDEQIAIYQEQINESYEAFVEKVALGRNMDVDEVKELADGRTYTANQALSNGLIDEISSYDDMANEMCSYFGVYDLYQPETKENIFSAIFSKIMNNLPKSDSQVLSEKAEGMESGVLMYYAEQLQ